MELSIRTVENNHQLLFEYFEANEVKCSKYLIGKEIGKKNRNEHYHYHLVITSCKTTYDSLKTAIRRKLYKYYNCKNYYVKEVKDSEKHELYVTKDGEYTHKGYSEEEINKLDEKNGKINWDKSLPVYQKIYNRMKERHEKDVLDASFSVYPLSHYAMDKRWLIREILTIMKEWDACAPTKTDMFRYYNYIQLKECDIDIAVENYN